MTARAAPLLLLDTPTLRRRVVPCESGEFVVTERLASVRGAPAWRVVIIQVLRREAA